MLLTPFPREEQMQPVEPNTPGHIGWHEIYAANGQEAAFAFYSAQFGWTTLDMFDMGPMGKYRIFGADGVRFGGMMDKPENPGRGRGESTIQHLEVKGPWPDVSGESLWKKAKGAVAIDEQRNVLRVLRAQERQRTEIQGALAVRQAWPELLQPCREEFDALALPVGIRVLGHEEEEQLRGGLPPNTLSARLKAMKAQGPDHPPDVQRTPAAAGVSAHAQRQTPRPGAPGVA
jgi:hypothetical protein